MRKILLAVMVAALGVTGVALGPTASAAFTCTGYVTHSVAGPVIVPSGTTCEFDGSSVVVDGSVTVQPGGRFHVGGGATIKGAVYSDRAGHDTSSEYWGDFSILVCNTHVTGSLTVTRATDSVYIGDDERCGPDRVDGAVTLNGNTAGVTLIGAANLPNTYCNLSSCGLGSSANVNNNSGSPHDEEETTGPGPSAEITYDHIAGSLNCTGNATIENHHNTVAGAKTGQCATAHPEPV
jgi:hypothetical protein